MGLCGAKRGRECVWVNRGQLLHRESAVPREMIDRVHPVLDLNDETRFHLNGVCFESDGSKSRMVSTDGDRLSKVECTIANCPSCLRFAASADTAAE